MKNSNSKLTYDNNGIICIEINNNNNIITAYPFDKIVKAIFVPGHEESITKYVKMLLGEIPLSEAKSLK